MIIGNGIRIIGKQYGIINKGGKMMHSEDISAIPCCSCGSVVYEFTVPSDIWNLIIRKNGDETDREYICVWCFLDEVIDYLRLQSKKVEVKRNCRDCYGDGCGDMGKINCKFYMG